MGKSPRKYKWEVKTRNKICTKKYIFYKILYVVSKNNNISPFE